jgi:hypothetical protein
MLAQNCICKERFARKLFSAEMEIHKIGSCGDTGDAAGRSDASHPGRVAARLADAIRGQAEETGLRRQRRDQQQERKGNRDLKKFKVCLNEQ